MKSFKEFYLNEKTEDTFTVYKGDFLSSAKNNSLARSYMSKLNNDKIEALKSGLNQVKLGNTEGIQSRWKSLDDAQKEAVVAYLITKYRGEEVESDSESESGGISSKYKTADAKRFLKKAEASLKGLPDTATNFKLDEIKEPLVRGLKNSKIDKEEAKKDQDKEREDTSDEKDSDKKDDSKESNKKDDSKGDSKESDEKDSEDDDEDEEGASSSSDEIDQNAGIEKKASQAIKAIDNKISEINSEIENRVKPLRVGKRNQLNKDLKELKNSKEFIKTYSRTANTQELKNSVENNISNALNFADAILKDVKSVKTEGEKAESKELEKARKEEAKSRTTEKTKEEKEKRKLTKKGATKYDLEKQKKEEKTLKKKGKREANIISRADNLAKQAERQNIDNSDLMKAVKDRDVEEISKQEEIIRNKLKNVDKEKRGETATKAGQAAKETATKAGQAAGNAAKAAGTAATDAAQRAGSNIRNAAQRAGTGIRQVINKEKSKEQQQKPNFTQATRQASDEIEALERYAKQRYNKSYKQLTPEEKKKVKQLT